MTQKSPHTQMLFAVCSLLMLLIPISFWLSGFTWATQPPSDTQLAWFVPITYSASMPYAIATAAILFIILILLSKKQYAWQSIVLIGALSLGGTQLAKSAIKHTVREPRPYVMQINETILPTLGYEKGTFYQLKKKQKRQVINALTQNETVRAYMQSDMGYSFPSGHTIFVVSWLLLFVGFLPRVAKRVAVPIMAIWAAAVLYSRVLLGMHHPIDLFAAILLAWAWNAFLFAKILPRLPQSFSGSLKDFFHQPKQGNTMSFIIEDTQIGNGEVATKGKNITVHYTGYLTDGTKFDSSLDRNQPFVFKLGAGQVIRGWDEGFDGMKIGGKRKLTIPPEMGYGSRAVGGVIPANSTLIFEVELLGVEN